LNKYEKLAVTGSSEQLGEWDPDQAILLDKEDGEFVVARNVSEAFFYVLNSRNNSIITNEKKRYF
jgi:Starch binding domain